MPNSGIEGEPTTLPAPSEFTWRGAPTLGRVHALNERYLQALTQLARSDREQKTLSVVNGHRTLWRDLSASARQRAARMPFLLMDVHFQDAQWWRAVRGSGSRSRPRGALSAAFTGKLAGELMRETLMLAWSTALLDRGTAGVLLGMAPKVSDIITTLGPQEVERIAARSSAHLRLRWQDVPAFWRNLLTAACAGDEAALHQSRLHGVQLLGSDLLPVLGVGVL